MNPLRNWLSINSLQNHKTPTKDCDKLGIFIELQLVLVESFENIEILQRASYGKIKFNDIRKN